MGLAINFMALNKPTGDMLNAGSNAAAQDLGSAAAGTSSSYSRADHVHKLPSAADVGAIATTQLGALGGVATLDAGGKLTTAQIPALTTSQISQITPVIIGAVATGDVIAITKGGTGAITASAARTALGITPANIGAISTDQASGFATLSSGTLRTDQVAALTGDVTSTAGNPATTVVKIQSQAISNQTPGAGQVLTWDGSQWAPATSTGGGGGGANGLTYYFNQSTAADAPVTNIPGTPHQLGRSGEAGQTTITTGSLTQNVWTLIAGFVSETAPQDPAVISIPAGLWDTNVWCFGDANVAAGTSVRAVAYIYSIAGGGTLTALGSPSSAQVINGTSAQYSLSVLVPQTAILATDRIYIALEAYATGNNHTVTAQFGDSTPSHIHTSLSLVGGTGLWKSVAGAVQSPATLLFNADVDPAAAIAASKISGLATSATTDTTNASNITSGTLSTSQLATISGLPTGAQGSANVIPVVTVDTKGRVTSLTTAQATTYATTSQLAAYVQTSQLTTLATAGGVPRLDGIGLLSTAQVPALTASQIAQITPAGIGAASLTGGTLTTSQMLALTGDVTTTAGSPATTLASITTAQSNVGNSTTVPVITVDAKGRVTTLTTAAISGAGGSGTGIQMATVRHTANITPAIAGTMTGAVWTNLSAVVTFTSTTVTLVPGMSFNGSGISALVIKSVDSATQITLSGNATGSGAQTLNVYNSTVSTMVTGTAPVIELRTLIAGDVVLLASQGVPATGGPWVVDSNSGTSFSLSRPTWFQGTLSQPLFIGIQQGNSGGGFVYTVGQNLGLIGPLTIGVDTLIVALTSSRAANAVTGTNLFTQYQTFRANGANSGQAPFFFQAGTLMTSPQTHAVEWDGNTQYITAGAVGTGVISGNTLTLSVTSNGQFQIGMVLTGTGIAAGTTIVGAGTGTGGAGTYSVSGVPQTVASTTITGSLRCVTAMFVTGAPSGANVPGTATSIGRPGQMAFNDTALYICTATNTWRRATLATF